MSVGNMEVDGQQSSNNGGENIHGIVVTPEIGNMMTTPTQIGKTNAIISNNVFLWFFCDACRNVQLGYK